MMNRLYVLSALFSTTVLTGTRAFSPNKIRSRYAAFGVQSPSVVVTSDTTALGSSLRADSEEDAMYLIMKANECAHSDTCSIEQADAYLNEVVHIQGGCAAGTLADLDICNDVTFVSQVVADLREKIEQGARSLSQDEVTKKPSLIPIYASLALATAVVTALGQTTATTYGDVSPFTGQEWWWAIRDGYLPQMLSHFWGFSAIDTADIGVAPFTAQEWWWAMRDGYLMNMVSHLYHNGGLASVSDVVDGVTPLTPEEWFLAIRDGYVDTVVRHGGAL